MKSTNPNMGARIIQRVRSALCLPCFMGRTATPIRTCFTSTKSPPRKQVRSKDGIKPKRIHLALGEY